MSTNKSIDAEIKQGTYLTNIVQVQQAMRDLKGLGASHPDYEAAMLQLLRNVEGIRANATRAVLRLREQLAATEAEAVMTTRMRNMLASALTDAVNVKKRGLTPEEIEAATPKETDADLYAQGLLCICGCKDDEDAANCNCPCHEGDHCGKSHCNFCNSIMGPVEDVEPIKQPRVAE